MSTIRENWKDKEFVKRQKLLAKAVQHSWFSTHHIPGDEQILVIWGMLKESER